MIVLTGTLPTLPDDAAPGTSKLCLGVYKKRAEVNEGRPTYVKVDDTYQLLWYCSGRWRFGGTHDLYKTKCDIWWPIYILN